MPFSDHEPQRGNLAVSPHSGRSDQTADARDSINRVLEAERRMADGLDHCRQRAEEIVEEARAQARRISRRTEDRIHLLHQRWGKAIERIITILPNRHFLAIRSEVEAPGTARKCRCSNLVKRSADAGQRVILQLLEEAFAAE